MALTITTSSTRVNGTDSNYWSLHGHADEVLCAAAYQPSICVTGDTDGLMLVWRFTGTAPEHVCCMRTNGPAILDVVWGGATTLLAAQGDGQASVWDVEKGTRTRAVSRYAVKGRCTWPVVNCIAATTRSAFVFGGDDGYLLTADTRSGAVASSVHLNVPITSAAATDYSLFVGDVCGTLHWFDTRVGAKALEQIPCGVAGITSVVVVPGQERLLAYDLDGTVRLVDCQPFALSSSDRLLGGTNLGENARQALLRGTWLPKSGAVALPSGAGEVVTVAPDDISRGVVHTLHQQTTAPPMNVCAAVGDGLILCGGGEDLVVYPC